MKKLFEVEMKKLLSPWDLHAVSLNTSVIYYVASVVVRHSVVVGMPDWKTGRPGFEFRSEQYTNFFGRVC